MDKTTDSHTVEIGGGEPFVHPDIADIITGIRQVGKLAHVATAGTPLPPTILQLDEKIRKGVEMQISLHAANRELYKHITGRDLFDRVLENIPKIAALYKTGITSAIYKDNLSEVKPLINLAYELELPIRINLVMPIGKGKNVTLLTPGEISRVRGEIVTERILKGNMVESPLLHQNTCYALAEAYGIEKTGVCPIDNHSKQYINPQGEKFSCEFWRIK